MNDYLNRYLNYLENERNYSPLTIKSYQKDIEDFLNYLSSENIKFLDVDKDVCRNYLTILYQRKLAKKSVAKKISSLKSFYHYLVRKQILDYSPFYTIKALKVEKKLPDVLFIDQINNIIDQVKINNDLDLRNITIFILMYNAGLRLSELTGIELDNIDFENKAILIKGKGNKQRWVYFDDDCYDLMQRYQNSYRDKYAKSEDKYYFINKKGARLSNRMVENIIKKIGGLTLDTKDIHPHTLRHSYATHLLDNQADIRVVQALLGHSSLNTTQIYTHISKSKLQEEYNKAHPFSKKEE